MAENIPHLDRHRRTRRDHESETAEDYVEAVADVTAQQGKCRIVDLAKRFGVSHVTVIRTVARLQEEGFLSTQPYHPIELTAKGTALANESQQRHEVVYQFLLSIGVDAATAAIDTEGIEHHVSPQTLEQFRKLTQRHKKKK